MNYNTSERQHAIATIIAHRGASAEAPENTLAAIRLAWQHGADAIEIDIHLTADNRIMVMHDPDTKRTAGVKHVIRDTTSEELRRLDVGRWKSKEYAGEKMPFLEEVLDTVPDGGELYVEIKCGTEILPFLENIIDTSGKRKQISIIGFGFHVMAATHQAFPDIPVCWLCELEKGNGGELVLKSYDYEKPVEDALRDAAENGICCIDVRHNHVNKAFVEAARRHGLDVIAWTVNKPRDFKRMLVAGVNSITTDSPGEMKKLLHIK